MSNIIRPGDGIIFMKVGTHAQEPLEAIIARKKKEIADTGFGLWGYGGPTCHPLSMVQPFAKSFEKRGRTIYLCMEEMESKHFADPVRADQSSADGVNWLDITRSINVVGSRYALVIKQLRREVLDLPLSETRVAVGPSTGRVGDIYVSGRVDKACLEIIGGPSARHAPEESKHISLVADLAPPYAVFLRNRP